MKIKNVLCVIALVFLTGNLMAQTSVTDIFEKDTKLAWYGLDFTQTQFVGEDVTVSELNSKYVPSWNQLLAAEKDKYDIGKFFNKKNVSINIGKAIKVSGESELAQDAIIYSEDKAQEFSEEQIGKMVKPYVDPEADEPLGLVFFVEQFNKMDTYGSFWITFFDTNSGKVLLTKRVQGAPGGIGFRNYWARTYYDAMVKVDEDLFDEWEDEQKE